jgi:hypothetical protein
MENEEKKRSMLCSREDTIPYNKICTTVALCVTGILLFFTSMSWYSEGNKGANMALTLSTLMLLPGCYSAYELIKERGDRHRGPAFMTLSVAESEMV